MSAERTAGRPSTGGLRGRLLTAFVFVAVPPLLIFAGFVVAFVSDRLERSATSRLDSGLHAVDRRLADLRRRAATQVSLAAQKDLPELAADDDTRRTAASVVAARRDLDVMEVVGEDGRVLSSSHWPAGVGLPDRDRPLGSTFRYEKVAREYGAVERLTLVASQATTWAGGPVTVRGGYLVDGEFLGSLAELMGMEVALRDAVSDTWVAPEGALLARWSRPTLGSRAAPASETAPAERRPADSGEAVVEATRVRWAAAPADRGLWVVVGLPHTLLAEVTGGLGRLTFGVAAAALVAAFGAALVLSARLARPVRALAEGARRVAAGDLEGRVPVAEEDEVGHLARAFNTMTDELRTSRERLLQAERVAAWREMARRLAHELKNPIFPIQLSIETLRRAQDQEATAANGGQRFSELFRESSETILEELRSLRSIIDEFSEFARMPRPAPAPVDVGAVIEKVLALYAAQAGKAHIESDVAAGLPAALADRDLLSRALGNLVANALEAMPDGGTLTVRARAVPEGVEVQVADTGPGLTEEQKTRLFTPYYTTKKGGTGLGLAIVQGIVADHGARIQVASEPGRGTTFTIVLPLAGQPAIMPVADSPSLAPRRRD